MATALRCKDEPVLKRARRPEDKQRVREAFVEAGRRLFARGEPSAVTLRAIAAEAGYAPSAIYQYFRDQHELFAAVREQEIDRACTELTRRVARTRDPRQRLEKLLMATVDYWAPRMDDFLLVFPPPNTTLPVAAPRREFPPFAETPVMRRILGLYEGAVGDFFRSLPRAPLTHRLATDLLLAAVFGTMVLRRMSRTKQWPEAKAMIRPLVRALLDQWSRAGRAA